MADHARSGTGNHHGQHEVLGTLPPQHLEVGELPDIGASLVPTQPEAYSVDVTRTGFGGYLGPGLLVRLTSRVNLDMGLTAGFGSLGKPKPRVEPGITVENSVKYWYALGTWVGIVIGIG